ncbi:RNA methyltransferase [Pseudohongiella sp.]|uniref:tRNA/rRNA methyltransferase SpoU type domain-containing protein n=1 Tax=marine sediment metagenome TaxID=412755 RepID=A0A0F9WGE8_9ZZZZ|nr:RNA methyltransferase [Pseudohongiella sp.]
MSKGKPSQSIAPDLSRVHVVLVNTSHPGNIGATARALKNMGIPNLRLVDPRDYPSDVAMWRAVSATDVLERAKVFPTLVEAVADCSMVIGASARSRRMPWPMLSPRQCARHVLEEIQRATAEDSGQIALVFGREDTGLTNDELQQCHYHVQIPANEDYSSLNLAAAVMVVCYEVRVAMLEHAGETRLGADAPMYDPASEDEYWDVPKADGHQMELFYEHLEKALVAMDFHDPENPRLLMPRMRRLFGRIRPDSMEINILRGVLTYVEEHVRRANAGDLPDADNTGNKTPKDTK